MHCLLINAYTHQVYNSYILDELNSVTSPYRILYLRYNQLPNGLSDFPIVLFRVRAHPSEFGCYVLGASSCQPESERPLSRSRVTRSLHMRMACLASAVFTPNR